ncbi:hypothetical protein DIPPA_02623 [Diplonema papillatum]|nr:hypothetical protein DIPPA_02623 [Diplonema papillatum]
MVVANGQDEEPLRPGGGPVWLEPKPSTVIAAATLPPNFTWLSEAASVAASGFPRRSSEVKALSDAGIKTIVTIHEVPLQPGKHLWELAKRTFGMVQPDDLLDGIASTGMHIQHVLCPDGESPPPSQLLALFKSWPSSNILFHCQSGAGRSGLLAAAYLCFHHGHSDMTALAFLHQLRRPLYPFVLNPTQVDALRLFCRQHRADETCIPDDTVFGFNMLKHAQK